MERSYEIFDSDGSVMESGHRDITWEHLRTTRDIELKATDHHALSDRTMSDEMGSYRVMLRDLPSDFEGENANDAADHWADNPRPEGA
jgi:hypothetical protein